MPIAAIVAFEASVAFSFYIIGMELIAGKEGIAATLPRLARNPVLITIALSLALNLAQVPIPEPIMTAARFAGVAFPGETYVVSWWREGDKVLFESRSKEREAPIITNGAITVRD